MKLKPAPYNPRKISAKQLSNLKKSMKEFGDLSGIIKNNTTGNLIGGHQRIKVLNENYEIKGDLIITEYGNFAYREVDWDEQKEKLANLAANKQGGEWDADGLKDLFNDLDLSNIDIDLTGFDLDEIGDITGAEQKEGLTDEDEVPETPEIPVSVLGDIWLLGNHRLMCGDSTDIEVVEKLMNGQKADMVFTDPPYGVDYKGIKNDDKEGLPSLLDSVFSNYLSISKSGASIYVFHSDKNNHIFRESFNKFFHFSSMVIWVKNSLTLSQTDYQSQHEPCLYGWMNNGTHSWHSDRKQTSIWKFDKERVEGHTTPKPVELVSRAVNNSSKGGDCVADFFGGSGSTLISCEKTMRAAMVVELDPKYIDVIINRWQNFTGKEATHSETGKTYNEMKEAI